MLSVSHIVHARKSAGFSNVHPEHVQIKMLAESPPARSTFGTAEAPRAAVFGLDLIGAAAPTSPQSSANAANGFGISLFFKEQERRREETPTIAEKDGDG